MEGGSVRVWDWIVGACGLALAVGVFMPWYRSNQENWTAFKSFVLIDLFLLLVAVLAIAVPIVANLKPTDKQVQPLLLALVGLGLLAVGLTIYRMATPPEFDTVLEPVSLKAGAFLSLIAAMLLTASAAQGARTRLARRARA